jgi:hypothetical protein
MKVSGVISADIVGSTGIGLTSKLEIIHSLDAWLRKIDKKYKCYSRITQGDLVEIVVPDISQTMRIALLIKSKVKSLSQETSISTKTGADSAGRKYDYFKQYGVRMAIDINAMDIVDRKNGIMEGAAIYNTGRKLSRQSTTNKSRIVVKESISFTASNPEWQEEFDVVFSLIDFILAKTTARQNEILNFKLLDYTDQEISETLEITQPGVNKQSNLAGWRVIQKAILHFEKTVVQ